MSEFTDKLKIIFPSEFESDWFLKFKQFANEFDINLFASLSDRNIIIFGGGEIKFENNAISWAQDLFVKNFAYPSIFKVLPRTVQLADFDAIFIKLNRNKPTISNVFEVDIEKKQYILVTDGVDMSPYILLCFRFGNKVVFRNGRILDLGTKANIFEDRIIGGGGAAVFFIDEDLSAQANGSNVDFSTSMAFNQANISMYINGLRAIRNDDFIVVSNTGIRFTVPPLATDKVIAHYLPEGASIENMIWEENITSQIDGTRTTFTALYDIAVPHLFVWLNGQKLVRYEDYNFVPGFPKQFVIVEAPQIGDRLVIQYIKA